MKKSICRPTQKIDRLSNMPDDVKNLIVSFLPMEEAMRTTILSRSWRFFCFSLANMIFNQPNFDRKHRRKEFSDFVDHILERHSEPSIQRFRVTVKCGSNQISTRRITEWISFAVCHRVRKLSFKALSRCFENLPCCIFTCSTLTSLKLCNIILKFPFVFLCPSLKKLNLDEIYCVGESGSISLNCDCPLLESLYLKVASRRDTLVIFAPAAKYVIIWDGCHTDRIILSFPNLLKIDHYGCRQPEFTSETLLSLSKAKFDMLDWIEISATKILMAFRNVETLSLCETYMRLLSRDSLSPFPITYCNLKELSVRLQPVMEEVLLLTSLLRCCPNLLSLNVISLGELGPPKNLFDIEGVPASEIHDGYMLKHLKEVTIFNIHAIEAELYLVSYLLQHANMMEAIYISFDASNKKNMTRIEKKLESFTRASPSVQLELMGYVSNRTVLL